MKPILAIRLRKLEKVSLIMDKILKNMGTFEPVAQVGAIGALVEAVIALLSQLIPGQQDLFMALGVLVTTGFQIYFMRENVTPAVTPRSRDTDTSPIPQPQPAANGMDGTREPVVLINSFIGVIEAFVPLAMMLGLISLTPEQKSALMMLVVAIGDFLAVILTRNEVTPVADPRDMAGEPLNSSPNPS